MSIFMIDAGDQWDTYWASGCMDCYRDDVVQAYIPFAEKVCGKIVGKLGSAYSHEEAMSDACLALIQSVPRYKLGMDACFETFAGRRIWGAICDSLRTRDLLSRSVREEGMEMMSLNQPVLVDESVAFDETFTDEIMEDIRDLMGVEDEVLFWHAFVNRDSETELCKRFNLTPAELVVKLNDLRWAAQLIMVEMAA